MNKQLQRWQTQAAQKLFRAEKTDVNLSGVDEDVERMMGAIASVKERMHECLKTAKGGPGVPGGGVVVEEKLDKRKHKLREYQLELALNTHAEELAKSHGGDGLLADVLGSYGRAFDEINRERVQMESEVQTKVIAGLSNYTDEHRRVKELREKTNRIRLDLDTSKRRRNEAMQSEQFDKVEKEQAILDEHEVNFQNARDNLIGQFFTLSNKEIEVACLFRLHIELQLAYHSAVARALEGLLPKVDKRIATYERRPVFGCHLEDHLRYTKREIALPIEVCCAALNELGLKDEGLLRLAGGASKVRKLRAYLDCGHVDLDDYDRDPHALSSVLKAYLRDLPDPLMTNSLRGYWKNVDKQSGQARIDSLKDTLSLLPPANYKNLRYVMKFLKKVAEEPANLMTVENLSTVMGPTLMGCGADESESLQSNRVVKSLIENADLLFPGEIAFHSPLTASLTERTGGFHTAAPSTAAVGTLAQVPVPDPVKDSVKVWDCSQGTFKLATSATGTSGSQEGGQSLDGGLPADPPQRDKPATKGGQANRPKAKAPPPPPRDKTNETPSRLPEINETGSMEKVAGVYPNLQLFNAQCDSSGSLKPHIVSTNEDSQSDSEDNMSDYDNNSLNSASENTHNTKTDCSMSRSMVELGGSRKGHRKTASEDVGVPPVRPPPPVSLRPERLASDATASAPCAAPRRSLMHQPATGSVQHDVTALHAADGRQHQREHAGAPPPRPPKPGTPLSTKL